MYDLTVPYPLGYFTGTVAVWWYSQYRWSNPEHGLTLITEWISNHMASEVWDEIIYPLQNFIGCTVGGWEWITYFIPRIKMDVITYACWDICQSMLVKGGSWNPVKNTLCSKTKHKRRVHIFWKICSKLLSWFINLTSKSKLMLNRSRYIVNLSILQSMGYSTLRNQYVTWERGRKLSYAPGGY